MYCIIGQCITYFSCRWGTIAHLNVTKRYGNRVVIGCLAAWFSIPGAALLCSAATYSTHVANLRKMLELETDSQHDSDRWAKRHQAHGGWYWHSPLSVRPWVLAARLSVLALALALALCLGPWVLAIALALGPGQGPGPGLAGISAGKRKRETTNEII